VTKNECQLKIEEMLPDIITYLRSESARLLGCGALNIQKDDPEGYRAAKTVLTVALENASGLYSPFPWDKAGRKEIRNLRRF
jgi:hypothetical protein